MKLKNNTVRMVGIHPALTKALFQMDPIFREELGYEMVITSANDRKHKRGSAHYSGRAVDLRTWTDLTSGQQIGPAHRDHLVMTIRSRLGGDFDVLSEKDHIHVEYDPKIPT